MEEQDELKQMIANARKVVAGCTTAAVATGAIPIPVADAPILIGEQVAMFATINQVFKFDINKDVLKKLLAVTIGTGGAAFIGKTIVSSALKLIPGVGTVAGAAISGSTAGVLTAALGNAYIELCKHMKIAECNDCNKYLLSKEGTTFFKDAFKKKKDTVKVSQEYVKTNTEQKNWKYSGFEKKGKNKQFNIMVKYENNDIGSIFFSRDEKCLKCEQINIESKYDEVVAQILEEIGVDNTVNILVSRDILPDELADIFNESQWIVVY